MAEFPLTGLLSDFEDPAENPLSESGAWALLTPDRAPMRKAGGEATDSAHGNPNYSVWVRDVFTSANGVEVWACLSGGQLGSALETWRVALWRAPYEALEGYLIYYGGGIGKGFTIRRHDGPTIDDRVDIVASGGGYPERLGLRIDGDNIEGWARYAGVWSLQCTVVDTTYRGNFYLGIGIEDPTGGGLSMPCFGGGRKNRTQIYRILQGISEED